MNRRPFRRRLAIRFAKLVRWLHIYLSMFGLAAVLFFSATGITLNHPLRLRVGPHLEPSLRALFDRLSNLRSRLFLLSSPNLTVTCLNQVVIGIKSSPRSMRKT